VNHSINQQQKKPDAVKKNRFSQKRWIFGGLAALFVVGLIVAWVIAMSLMQTTEKIAETTTEESSQDQRQQKVAAVQEEAQKKASEQKSVSGATTTYDKAIKEATDPKVKSELSLNKASVLYNSKKPNDAIDAALAAEGASPSRATADFLAQLYYQQNNKPKALEFYKKALDRLDKSASRADVDAKQYEALIKNLSES